MFDDQDWCESENVSFGSPRQRPLTGCVCVCVCLFVCLFVCLLTSIASVNSWMVTLSVVVVCCSLGASVPCQLLSVWLRSAVKTSD